jgi:peptidoglycan/LPS O-acetylase OafA/YrhL
LSSETIQVVAGNTTKTKPENRAFYPALDGFRAVAFLMVFLQHYLEFPWGWAGVDLFFVLSGFLITGILFDSRDDLHRVRNFYVRRTLRIFPLYYGIMLVLLLSWPVFHWQISWRWLAWPAYLGNFARFLRPFPLISPMERFANFQPVGTFHGREIVLFLGHFWSLCVEEQFYLVWPWIVFWVRDRRKLLNWCVATIVLCPLLRLLGSHWLPLWMQHNEVFYRATPFRLDALLLGGLLALLLRGPAAPALLRFARRLSPLLVLPLAYIAFQFVRQHTHHASPYYPAWKFTWGLDLVDALAALILLVAIQPGTIPYRLLNQRILRWIGRLSYGAYVLHDIFHATYFEIALRLTSASAAPLIATMIALVSTMVLAWLSFRFFESPFLNLKERWTIR